MMSAGCQHDNLLMFLTDTKSDCLLKTKSDSLRYTTGSSLLFSRQFQVKEEDWMLEVTTSLLLSPSKGQS